MKIFFPWLSLLLPCLVFAQDKFDITGRISFRMLNVQYDEQSEIKPDSVADREYAKSTLIPGLQQSLNLAFFARTHTLDLTLLGDIQNNPWNKLNRLEAINRLSLSARFGSENELILGDFFESGSEFFIQSREVRGAKLYLHFNKLWNNTSFLETKVLGGRIERAVSVGDPLKELYRQYESTGQYRRFFAAGLINLGDYKHFTLGLRYLFAQDDSTSIAESFKEPLANQIMGLNGSLFLWAKKIRFFGDGFLSTKDTLSGESIQDHSYQGGLDFRIEPLKLMITYYRFGYNYYTAGFPFLLNNRQGLKADLAYNFPHQITLFTEAEQYKDNLDKIADSPVTRTRLLSAGCTTTFKGWPELTFKVGFRDDNSPSLLTQDSLLIQTDRVSFKYEGRIAYNMGSHRFSVSGLFIDLDDESLLAAGSPLGTEQWISSLNFYSRPTINLFLSAGIVYSHLLMTNAQDNQNIYFYESSRWDLIPRRLKFETTVSYIYNDAAKGGFQDLLSDYSQLGAEFSLEYFFSANVSFKAIGGTDLRHMRYSNDEALKVIADPDYGVLFFNGFESYHGLKYGAELNWIF